MEPDPGKFAPDRLSPLNRARTESYLACRKFKQFPALNRNALEDAVCNGQTKYTPLL